MENRVCVRSAAPNVISCIRFLFASNLSNIIEKGASILEVTPRSNGYQLSIVDRENPCVVPEEALMTSVSNAVLYRLIDQETRCVMLHAAAVEKNGVGIILLAPSGGGKTTLTSWLIGQGYHCLTDELVAVDDAANMQGLLRPLNVKASGLELVRHFNWLSWDGAREHNNSEITFVPYTNKGTAIAKLTIIIFPRYRPRSELRVKNLSKGECAAKLMTGLLNAKHLPQHGIRNLVALATQRPSYEIHYSDLSDVSYWLSKQYSVLKS